MRSWPAARTQAHTLVLQGPEITTRSTTSSPITACIAAVPWCRAPRPRMGTGRAREAFAHISESVRSTFRPPSTGRPVPTAKPGRPAITPVRPSGRMYTRARPHYPARVASTIDPRTPHAPHCTRGPALPQAALRQSDGSTTRFFTAATQNPNQWSCQKYARAGSTRHSSSGRAHCPGSSSGCARRPLSRAPDLRRPQRLSMRAVRFESM